jgi:hypothetical protein
MLHACITRICIEMDLSEMDYIRSWQVSLYFFVILTGSTDQFPKYNKESGFSAECPFYTSGMN